MTDLVYKPYNRIGSVGANVSEVSDMINGKPVKVDHDISIDSSSWSDNLGHYTRINLGLPTERHHQILTGSLERLGYF